MRALATSQAANMLMRIALRDALVEICEDAKIVESHHFGIAARQDLPQFRLLTFSLSQFRSGRDLPAD
jgi:hypothetical protein